MSGRKSVSSGSSVRSAHIEHYEERLHLRSVTPHPGLPPQNGGRGPDEVQEGRGYWDCGGVGWSEGSGGVEPGSAGGGSVLSLGVPGGG